MVYTYEPQEIGAPADPRHYVECVLEILHYTDPSPACKDKPLNYTQLQLEVQMAMAADPYVADHRDYYARAFEAIGQHMRSRFALLDVGDQLVAAHKSMYAAAREAGASSTQ